MKKKGLESINRRGGLNREDDSLPKSLIEELQDLNNPKSKVPLEELKILSE